MRMRWTAVAGSAVIVVGLYVFYTYPRPVAVSLHGVQLKMGSRGYAVTPVTITLHGTRDRFFSTRNRFKRIYGTTRHKYQVYQPVVLYQRCPMPVQYPRPAEQSHRCGVASPHAWRALCQSFRQHDIAHLARQNLQHPAAIAALADLRKGK